jgi:hypothetical protein
MNVKGDCFPKSNNKTNKEFIPQSGGPYFIALPAIALLCQPELCGGWAKEDNLASP